MRRLFVLSLGVVIGGCVAEAGDPDLGSAAEPLVVTSACEVRGMGSLPEGEFLLGSVKGDADGSLHGVWHHWTPPAEDGPGRSEDAVGHSRAERTFFQGHADSLVCRVNGVTLAIVEGTGRVGGEDGYTFRASVQDDANGDRYTFRAWDASGALAIDATGVLDAGDVTIQTN